MAYIYSDEGSQRAGKSEDMWAAAVSLVFGMGGSCTTDAKQKRLEPDQSCELVVAVLAARHQRVDYPTLATRLRRFGLTGATCRNIASRRRYGGARTSAPWNLLMELLARSNCAFSRCPRVTFPWL